MMAIPWPITSDELKRLGYQYDNDGACKACQAPLEWWITPGGAKMPMSIIKSSDRNTGIAAMMKDPGDKRQPHFIDCPDAKKFRKEN
jgi:hypothetical protein